MKHKQQIHTLESELTQNNRVQSKEYQKLAITCLQEFVPNQESHSLPDGINKPEILSLAREIVLKMAKQTKTRNQITEIKEQLDQQKQFQLNLTEQEKSIKELESEVVSRHETIGENAFQAYLTNPDRYSGFYPLFKDIILLQETLQKTNPQDVDNSEKNPLQKFIQRGAALADQLKKSGAQRKLRVEYTRLGKELLQTDFLAEAKNPNLVEAAAPALLSLEKQETLWKDVEDIKASLAKVQEKIGSALEGTNATNAERAISFYENQISTMDREITSKCITLGNEIYRIPEAETVEPFVDFIQSLKDIEKSNSLILSTIEKHKAAIRALDTQKKIDQLSRDERQLQKLIKDKQTELEGINSEKSLAEESLKKAMKEAGEVMNLQD